MKFHCSTYAIKNASEDALIDQLYFTIYKIESAVRAVDLYTTLDHCPCAESFRYRSIQLLADKSSVQAHVHDQRVNLQCHVN